MKPRESRRPQRRCSLLARLRAEAAAFVFGAGMATFIRAAAFVAVGALALAAAPAPAQDRGDDGLADGGATLRGARGLLHLPPGVRRLADVAYGPDPRQRFDVYLPPSSPSPVPILVMVHGGAWMLGNKAAPAVVEAKAARWVAQGAVLVSVGYRLVPQVGVMDEAADVAHALAEVQRLAPGWGADPARLVLLGHSAGAHLVALLAASPTLAAQAGARPWLGTVMLDSAALDLGTLMQRRHARFYDRVFGNDPALWRAASPIEQLAPGRAPMLLVCSTQRRDDSCGQSRRFAERAAALGVRASVAPEDLSHGEINATLGAPGAETDAVQAFFASIGLGVH